MSTQVADVASPIAAPLAEPSKADGAETHQSVANETDLLRRSHISPESIGHPTIVEGDWHPYAMMRKSIFLPPLAIQFL
jgi:hypothetical protein